MCKNTIFLVGKGKDDDARDDPSVRGLPVMKLISVVVGCDDVQKKDVFRFRVQPGHAELHLWEHLSAIGISFYLNRPFKINLY